MFESLCISLVLTIIVETVLAVLVKIRDKDSLSAIAWINCLTNPVVVYISNLTLLMYDKQISTIVLLVLEILVIPVEGMLFKKKIKREDFKPYMLSLYLNALSFVIGMVIGWSI